MAAAILLRTFLTMFIGALIATHHLDAAYPQKPNVPIDLAFHYKGPYLFFIISQIQETQLLPDISHHLKNNCVHIDLVILAPHLEYLTSSLTGSSMLLDCVRTLIYQCPEHELMLLLKKSLHDENKLLYEITNPFAPYTVLSNQDLKQNVIQVSSFNIDERDQACRKFFLVLADDLNHYNQLVFGPNLIGAFQNCITLCKDALYLQLATHWLRIFKSYVNHS